MEFRTRAISALHALVTSAPETLRERLRSLPLGELLRSCAALRGSARQDAEAFATVMTLRATARRALACQTEAADLDAQIDALVRRIAPWLLDQVGIGPVVAGQIIVSWSHRGRLRTEAAFAKLAGVAPSRLHRASPYGTVSTGQGTASSTERCTPSSRSACAKTPEPRHTSSEE